jgi:hypothetical protein
LSSWFSLSTHGDQRQPEIAHFPNQAMQRGLVDHVALDKRGAITLAGEAQPVEPGGAAGVEVPLDSDFVAPSLFSGMLRRKTAMW